MIIDWYNFKILTKDVTAARKFPTQQLQAINLEWML